MLTKTINHSLARILTAGLALSSPLASRAGELANPGDEAYRYHLTALADSGDSDQLVSVWPSIPANTLPAATTFDRAAGDTHASFDFVANTINSSPDHQLQFQIGTEPTALRGFDSDFRDPNQITYTTEGKFGALTAHLEASAVDSPEDGKSLRLDGSYLALDWQQWRLGFGRVDRWWGPGWQTSLILSNNARPSPGFFFERNTHRSSDLPILKYLGPWHVTAFANQLEGDRYVPNAKLLGARFTFKPFDSLEIGISRTAQWGGEGRPETLGNFLDLLLGKDNVGSDGIELDGSNEPGNQLGGFDFRWTSKIAGHPFSVYGQLIGEDEAGGLPSREIGMIGMDTEFNTQFSEGFLFAEASDTGMNFLNGTMFNSAYNHHIYRDGYRYYGDTIGASIDNDSRLVTLGGYQEFGDNQSITWKAHYASLNRDGIAANNPVSAEHLQTAAVSASFHRKLTENASIGIEAHHFLNHSLPASSGLSKSSVQLTVSLLK